MIKKINDSITEFLHKLSDWTRLNWSAHWSDREKAAKLSFSSTFLFRLHRQYPGGRPLTSGYKQHKGNFTERGILQVK